MRGGVTLSHVSMDTSTKVLSPVLPLTRSASTCSQQRHGVTREPKLGQLAESVASRDLTPALF
jgi:hypothetical protein